MTTWAYLMDVEEEGEDNEVVFPFRTIINKYVKGKGRAEGSS